jgi:hypothetical protein
MGCYLFQNDRVYFFVDGQIDAMARDEFLLSSMVEDKNAHVLIAQADGPVFMDDVRRIRQTFPRRAIKTCVPYAAALRAFLQMRGISSTGESCLVADDLGDKFLLTASNGRQVAVTRAILSRDPLKIVDEIRRTQKSVMEKDGPFLREPVLRILSNNSCVIDALDPERKKDARFFETSFPAFEVLGKIKFPVQLMPPEEVVMQKQADLRRGLIAASFMAALISAIGMGCFSWAKAHEDVMEQKIAGLVRDKIELQQEEKELATLTYQEKLNRSPKMVFVEVFDQFLRQIPLGAHIEQVSFERGTDMRWRFTGLALFPRQEILEFSGKDIFKEARVEHIFIQTRPGIRVSLLLPDDMQKGLSL